MKRKWTVWLILALLFHVLPFPTGASPEAGYYTDWNQIQEKAAVAMLTDLGLVSGYDNGSFQPFRPVTRAEAAKLISGLLDPELTVGETCRYPDTVGNWAAGYIEFCAERGIISGPAGTNFRPGEAVTVRELAKMLLTVLGYDAGQYTGPDWAAATDLTAEAAGLYNGSQDSPDRTATRQETCLLLNNALQASVVQGYTEDGEPVYDLDEMLEPKTLLELRFEAVPVTGVVQANAAADLRTEPEKLGKDCIHLSGYVKDFQVSPQIAGDESLLGHRVILYARLGSDGNKVLGIPVISSDEISHEVNGPELLQAVLDVGGLFMDDTTSYYLNYAPANESCLKKLDSDQQVSVIDHNGDRVIDVVLVEQTSEDQS